MRSTLLYIPILLLFCGCMPRLSSPLQIFEGRVATSFDFAPYAEQDFLFTAGSYQQAYEPRGYISLAFSPRSTDALRADRRPAEGWTVEDSRVQPILQQMYDRAIALEADAISHFSVDIERGELGKAVYRVSGFAIRRL